MNKFITLFDKLIAEQKEFLKKDTLHKIITQQTEKDQTKSEQPKPYIEQMKQLFIRIGSQNGKGDEKRLAAGFDKNLKEKSVVLFFIYDKNANVLFRYVKLSIFNSDPQQYITAIKNSEEHIKAKNATVGFTNEQKRRIRNYKPIICKAISIIQPEEYPNIEEAENTFNQHLAKKEILYINDKKEITYLTIDEFFTNYKTYYKNIKSIIDNNNVETKKADKEKEKIKINEKFSAFVNDARTLANSLPINYIASKCRRDTNKEDLYLEPFTMYDVLGLPIKKWDNGDGLGSEIDSDEEILNFTNFLKNTEKNGFPIHPECYKEILKSLTSNSDFYQLPKAEQIQTKEDYKDSINAINDVIKKYPQFCGNNFNGKTGALTYSNIIEKYKPKK